MSTISHPVEISRDQAAGAAPLPPGVSDKQREAIPAKDSWDGATHICDKRTPGGRRFSLARDGTGRRRLSRTQGRTFDGHMLDMIELGLVGFRSLAQMPGLAKRVGSKPAFVFLGDLWTREEKYKKLQNLLLGERTRKRFCCALCLRWPWGCFLLATASVSFYRYELPTPSSNRPDGEAGLVLISGVSWRRVPRPPYYPKSLCCGFPHAAGAGSGPWAAWYRGEPRPALEFAEAFSRLMRLSSPPFPSTATDWLVGCVVRAADWC